MKVWKGTPWQWMEYLAGLSGLTAVSLACRLLGWLLLPHISRRDGQESSVVMVHGLWMGRLSLWRLRLNCLDHGQAVIMVGYRHGEHPERIVERIARDVAVAAGTGHPVHLVGFSAGGALALMASQHPLAAGKVETIVCLGTPLRGSEAVRLFTSYPFAALVLGRVGRMLYAPTGVPLYPVGLPVPRVIMVAGNRQRCWCHSPVKGPGDGTVRLVETLDPALHAHFQVSAGHMGLLYASQSLEIIEHMLSRRSICLENVT